MSPTRSSHFKSLTLLLLIVATCFLTESCQTERESKGRQLINSADAIIANSDSATKTEVDSMINILKDYIKANPQDKDASNIFECINQLDKCKDAHFIRMATKQYDQLTKSTFEDPSQAISQCNSFMAQFNNDYGIKLADRRPIIKTYLEDIANISSNFHKMQSFIDQDFASLNDYNDQLIQANSRFNNNSYESVRRTWNKILPEKTHEVIQQEVAREEKELTEKMRSVAEEQAKKLTSGYNISSSKPTKLLDLNVQRDNSSANTIFLTGKFEVNMVGAFLGIDHGTIIIQIKAQLSVHQGEYPGTYTIHQEIKDYTILERRSL